MRRTRPLALVAAFTAATLILAAPAGASRASRERVVAPSTVPTPAVDCNTEGTGYPKAGAAEGATFLGVSTGRSRNDKGFLVYSFDVKKVYAGNIGSTVRVELVCMWNTRFPIGRTFLVSSGAFRPADGSRIVRLRYVDWRAVAWRVFADNTVELKTDRSVPPPPYLRQPDTLRQAVRAVAPS